MPSSQVCYKPGTQIAHSYLGRFLDHCATCCSLGAHSPRTLADLLVWSGPFPPLPDTSGQVERSVELGETPRVEPVSGVHIGGCSSAAKPPPGPGRADADERVYQINRWLSIIEVAKTTSKAGRLGADFAMCENLFAKKATGTLARRSGSIGLYIKWYRDTIGREVAFPPTENIVYAYLEHLRLSQSPASRGKSFLESVNFCCGTTGLDLGTEVLSPRIFGSSERMLRTKRITVKAPPLPAQVARGDASRLLEEPLLETAPDGSKAVATKGARDAKRQKLGLPVTAVRRGLIDRWACESACEADAAKDGALMLALDRDGRRVRGVPMSSTQLTYFARRLFQDMNLVGDLPLGFTSHSCKATILSWLSKASVRLEDRRLLGGHAKPGERVPLEYSRDALAGPLLTLERVVRAVKLGIFRPDSTRSGRWARGFGPEVLASLENVAVLREGDAEADGPVESDTDESDSGTASRSSEKSTDDASGGECAMEECAGEEKKANISQRFRYAHNVATSLKHIVLEGSTSSVCGMFRVGGPVFKWGALEDMKVCHCCKASSAVKDLVL